MASAAPGFSLVEPVRRHARERPAAVAVSCGDATLTYAELDDRSGRLAALLAQLGSAAGDRVLHLDLNAPQALELLLATAKLGATFTPLNHRLTVSELRQVATDADAPVLVCGPTFAATGATLAAESGGRTRLLAYGAGLDAPWIDHALLEHEHATGPDDVLVQHYTSGTTGRSKGVMLTSASIGAMCAHAPAPSRVHRDARVLVASPTFHIGGMAWAMEALHEGGEAVMVAQVAPETLLDTLERRRVTIGLIVPTVLQMLTDVPGAAERDWSRVEAIAYGASPMTSSALKRAMRTFGCPFLQQYGMTETSGPVTQLEPGDHDPDGPREHLLRSAGRPYDFVELEVVDAESRALPPGEIGEVRVRSPVVMAGYFGRPEETAATLSDDGWLRTGDGGYRDADGYLFLTDRVKDMIVSGGENVYPVEVEEVLAKHPAVAEVAVIGLPDPRWIETVVAVVVPRRGETLAADDLVAFARTELAGYKLPRIVELASELPKTPTGKVLKRELRERYGG